MAVVDVGAVEADDVVHLSLDRLAHGFDTQALKDTIKQVKDIIYSTCTCRHVVKTVKF